MNDFIKKHPIIAGALIYVVAKGLFTSLVESARPNVYIIEVESDESEKDEK